LFDLLISTYNVDKVTLTGAHKWTTKRRLTKPVLFDAKTFIVYKYSNFIPLPVSVLSLVQKSRYLMAIPRRYRVSRVHSYTRPRTLMFYACLIDARIRSFRVFLRALVRYGGAVAFNGPSIRAYNVTMPRRHRRSD